MIRKLSAAPLAYINADHLTWIRACEAAELDYLGLRLVPTGYAYEVPQGADSPLFRDIKALLDDSRVQVLDIELLVLNEHSQRDDWLPLLEMGQQLGAQYINTSGNDTDSGRFEDNLAQLAEDSRRFGIITALEPIAYRTLNSYADSVRLAKKYDCVVEFDGLHFVRTGAKLSDVTRHAELYPIAQLCDAALAVPTFDEQQRRELGAGLDEPDAVVESRYFRTPAGEGIAPWSEVMHALPETTVVALETANALNGKTMSAAESLIAQARYAREFLLSL